MGLALEVISGHPIFASFITRVLFRDAALRKSLDMADPSDASCASRPGPKLYLVDACSYNGDPAELCRRLRRVCPGNRFFCLLPSTPCSDEKKLELLCAGMDGMVYLRGNWENELRRAVTTVLAGDYWFPRAVLRQYIRQTAGFLMPEESNGLVLTTREIQVTNLVLRKCSNREISERLSISVRTVKFHVSALLAKFAVTARAQLSEFSTARMYDANYAGKPV